MTKSGVPADVWKNCIFVPHFDPHNPRQWIGFYSASRKTRAILARIMGPILKQHAVDRVLIPYLWPGQDSVFRKRLTAKRSIGKWTKSEVCEVLEKAGPWSYVSIAIWGRALNACRLAVIGAKSADTHAGAVVKRLQEKVTDREDQMRRGEYAVGRRLAHRGLDDMSWTQQKLADAKVRLAIAKDAEGYRLAAERLRTARHCVESVTQAMDELFYVDPPGLFGACFQLTYLQGIVDGYPKQLLAIERRENELKQQRKRLRKEHDIAANKIAKLKKTQESE